MIQDIAIRTAIIEGLLVNVKKHDAINSPYVINAQKVTPDVSIGVSKLNTLVYTNLIFNKVEGYWDDFVINDCLIQVSQAKKIITTEIQGKDGTIKEYIGLDDYQVQITGRLNGSYGVNPKGLTKILKTILSAGQPLAVTSWWLQNLDITDIVIKDFNFAQTEGEYSTQYFSINALSDKIIEARIIS